MASFNITETVSRANCLPRFCFMYMSIDVLTERHIQSLLNWHHRLVFSLSSFSNVNCLYAIIDYFKLPDI